MSTKPEISGGVMNAGDYNLAWPDGTHGQGFIEGNAFNYGLYVPRSSGLAARVQYSLNSIIIKKNLYISSMSERYKIHPVRAEFAHGGLSGAAPNVLGSYQV